MAGGDETFALQVKRMRYVLGVGSRWHRIHWHGKTQNAPDQRRFWRRKNPEADVDAVLSIEEVDWEHVADEFARACAWAADVSPAAWSAAIELHYVLAEVLDEVGSFCDALGEVADMLSPEQREAIRTRLAAGGQEFALENEMGVTEAIIGFIRSFPKPTERKRITDILLWLGRPGVHVHLGADRDGNRFVWFEDELRHDAKAKIVHLDSQVG